MRPGDVIDERFTIERLAASGGMGRIFLARDRHSGEAVAVKALLGAQTVDIERFRREIRVLAELSHPGIVRYIAHGFTAESEPYLVMEWLDGEDLSSRLRRGRLTVAESLTLAAQAAEALGVVHALGIIHRDLQPKNLFLVGTRGGRLDRVKLLDFGISRPEGATQLTQAGALMGTPGYIAPEQCRSEQALDARVDVYTLGCVLFECLTGRTAFKGQHAMAVLVKILFEDAPRVREFLPEVPAELDALVSDLMAKDREGRPRDGAAVVAALADLGARPLTRGAAPDSSLWAPTLTRVEQRMLSVILLSRPQASGGTPTGPDGTLRLSGGTASGEETIEKEVAGFGGRLERLLDGSLVVTITGERIATDQAALAARCALALAGRCPERKISLATGYKEATRRTPMPVSDAFERAAGLLASEESAAGDTVAILIDEVTAALLDARFDVRESKAGSLAGLFLRGLRELPEGMRTLLGRPTSCVGRDLELALLDQVFSSCLEEPLAQAVLVTAQAGMGKSRLVHEFLGRRERQGIQLSTWIGRGDALALDSPLALLGQAIRSVCGIREGDPLELRREKLGARVARHVGEDARQRVTVFLGELVGTPFVDEDNAPLRAARKDAQLLNEQMLGAWIDFLRAEATAGPLVLVLEDLHWGDLPTVRFIDRALRDLRPLPWMVVALARPEVHRRFPQLWHTRAVQVIQLQPLGRKAGERLVRQALGPSVEGETVAHLLNQADGNPFYLEELIRATAERGGEVLPETVIAMVQSRLGALDEEARQVLRAASVFGESFCGGAVAFLLGSAAPSGRLHAQLGELVEQEVLVQRPESRFPGEKEYAFRHALLREGAYAMLVEEDRILGHRLAGEWLHEHGENDAIVLAEHFARGHQPARAVGLYLRSAELALAMGDADAAVAHGERGLACGASGAERLELLGLVCEAQFWRFQREAAASYLEEVLRLATPGSLPWARAMMIRLMLVAHSSQTHELVSMCDALLTATPAPGSLLHMALALGGGAYALDYAGRVGMADALLERLQALIEPVAEHEPVAVGWMCCTVSRRLGCLKDDPWEGLLQGERGVARFREAQHPRGIFTTRTYVAINRWLLGELTEAETELRQLGQHEDLIGETETFRGLALVGVLAERGALEAAREEAERMIAAGRSRSLLVEEGRGTWALAEVLRQQGELGPAETAARMACERLASLPPDLVPALATLAAILLAQGRAAEAHAVASEAMMHERASGACDFGRGVFLRTVHAECLRAVGDEAGARAAITEAYARLEAAAARIPDPGPRDRYLARAEHVRTLGLARDWLGEDTKRGGLVA